MAVDAPKERMVPTNGNLSEDGEIEDDAQALRVARASSTVPKKEIKRPLIKPGVYIPPARRRLLEQQALEESIEPTSEEAAKSVASSLETQRESWQSQKRVIHGTINRLNAGTIKPLIQELFQKVNLIRFRGVLCKNILQDQQLIQQQLSSDYE